MPEVDIAYPDGMFGDDAARWGAFLGAVAEVTAAQMSGVNPQTEWVTFDPAADVDIISVPYHPLTSRPTAAVLLKVITYAWPQRMLDLEKRLLRITDVVAPLVPAQYVMPGMMWASTTFLVKPSGGWFAA